MWYNRLMVYNVTYNGLNFVNNPQFRKEWGTLCLKEFGFFELPTSAKSEQYAIRHWEFVSPTLLKNRRIRFLFDILADSEQERRALLNKVHRAFSPENNPSPFNKNLRKDLSFMDIEWNVRECKCQVYQWVQLSDFANQKWVWISVELITDWYYMKSGEEFSSTIKNTQSGIRLRTKLPFHWVYYTEIDYDGFTETPVTMEMEILDATASKYPYDKIKIIHDNWSGQKVMYIQWVTGLWMHAGDKITVDSEKRRCYFKNHEWEVDITGLVSLGSERPALRSWINKVWIDVWVRDEVITATVKRNKIF